MQNLNNGPHITEEHSTNSQKMRESVTTLKNYMTKKFPELENEMTYFKVKLLKTLNYEK